MATKFKQNMEVTGRVTAVQFEGDGSLVTGISGGNFAGDITEVIAGVGITRWRHTRSSYIRH